MFRSLKEQPNDIRHLEYLLKKLNKIIIEYHRTLLIGDKVRIANQEANIRALFSLEEDANIRERLKSAKGNLQWNIVRLQPGRRFYE